LKDDEKKVSRRIEKKIYINNKIVIERAKTGELRLQKEFWDKRALDGLKTHTCSLCKSDRQGRMFPTRFYKGATPSTSKCLFFAFCPVAARRLSVCLL